MLMSFEDCTVTYNEEALFLPEWGMYDMAVGQKITSVFSGAADRPVFSKTILSFQVKRHSRLTTLVNAKSYTSFIKKLET